jgi:hypothetical protein
VSPKDVYTTVTNIHQKGKQANLGTDHKVEGGGGGGGKRGGGVTIFEHC